MSQFVRIGNEIVPKPKGTDYDLVNGKCYCLIKKDDWTGTLFLKEENTVKLATDHIYESKQDILFKQRVINNFNSSEKTTGVLLAGLKGSGKTLAAKLLCKQANLPVIIVDPSFNSRDLNRFFTSFNTPVAIIFDEVDKNTDKRWDTAQMLSFLDGMQDTGKKLVVFTCNETKSLDDNLLDRCSRIRYYKCYKALDRDTVKLIIDDIMKNNKDTVILLDFIMNHIKTVNYDNIISFVKEVYDYCDEITEDSLMDLIKDMNIETI